MASTGGHPRKPLYEIAGWPPSAGAPAALAVSPHFINAKGTLNSDGSLTVNFKEAGLGTNQNIDYVLSADATATYVCVNRGGANPSAHNKTTVSGPVSATGTFSSGKNGNVTASLTVQPPPSDISCPPGQSRNSRGHVHERDADRHDERHHHLGEGLLLGMSAA